MMQCYQLYYHFIREKREDERVRSAGDQIKKTITNVNKAVGSVRESAGAYNHTLQEVNTQLAQEKTKEEISSILGHVWKILKI